MTENAMFNAIIDFGADVNDIGSVSTMIKDILVTDMYRAKTPYDTVVDIGSNIGAFALVASNYARRVISVEASPWAIDAQRDMLHELAVLNVITTHRAVGSSDKVWIQRSRRHVYDSAMTDDAPASIYMTVPVVSLQELFTEYDVVPEVTSLKMNTNGSEVDVYNDPRSMELLARLASLVLVSRELSVADLTALGRRFTTSSVDAIGDGRFLLVAQRAPGNF